MVVSFYGAAGRQLITLFIQQTVFRFCHSKDYSYFCTVFQLGNPVKIGDSTRCCNSFPNLALGLLPLPLRFGLTTGKLPLVAGLGKALTVKEKSENLLQCAKKYY
jgi:hypothetical protein